MAARTTPSAGAKPDKLWRDALMRAVKRKCEETGEIRLERLADSCVKAGIAGDIGAIREIGDRLDGKAVQQISGDSDAPLEIIIRDLTRKVVTD